MKKIWQDHCKRGVIIALVLCLISMVCASMLQTNFGNVTIKDIRTETNAGLTLSGLLYVPDTATAENPAPAVVVVHGWWKTRESQSSVSMELARRGYVVFDIDMYGHGNSSDASYKFVDSYNAVELLADLPYVNAEQIGITGHSMGGKCCSAVTQWANAGGSVDVAAMVIAGTDPIYVDENGAYTNIYGNRDVCVIAARYDDFEYHGSEIHGPWINAPRDYVTTDVAKSFVNFGEDPATFEGEIEVGKIYEKEIDGKIAKREIFTPTQIHSWFVLSPVSVAIVVDFFNESIPAPNPIAGGNQLAMVKECFTLLGLIGMFMFLVYFTKLLLETKMFACLKAKEPVKPLPAPKGKGLLWFWGSLLAGAAVSYLTLFPVAIACLKKVNPLLPIGQAKSLGVWGVISGVFMLLVLFLNYKFYSKKNGFDLRERGVILPKGTWPKTILLAVIVVVASYSLVFVADYFFKTDFRFWTLAARAFESDKALYVLTALPLFLMYYIPNSISTNCFRYTELGKKEWMNTAVVALTNALGCIIILLVQYSVFLATGFSMWHDSGAQKSAIGWLYAVVVILAVAPIIARKIYKATNNPYLAGIINAAMVSILCCTSTTTVLYSISEAYIPG